MAQPTLSSVHVNRPLTNVSVAYIQRALGVEFIAEKVFPAIPVDKASDLYFEYNRGDFNRDTMKVRALSSESSGDGYRTDANPTYLCQQWSLHKDIDDRIRANYDTPLGPDRDATLFLTQKALIRKEVFWASNFFTGGKWTGSATGNTSASSITAAGGTFYKWSSDSSTPIEDIFAAKTAIRLNSGGAAPNKLTLSEPVWYRLLNHPDLIDRVKYGQTAPNPAMATRSIVAQILELDEVLVANAILNSSEEAGETNGYIMSNGALLTYSPKQAGILTPSAGYTFNWTGLMTGLGEQVARDADLGAAGVRIKTFRMEEKQSDRVEIDAAFDMRVVSPDCGFFFGTVL